MIHIPTKKSLKEKDDREKMDYPLRKKYFEKKCTRSTLSVMAFYADEIPWYDGLVFLSDEKLERCKNSLSTKNSIMIILKKVFILLVFMTLVAVTFALLKIYYSPFSKVQIFKRATRLGVWLGISALTGILTFALLAWIFDNDTVKPKFIKEIKQYRDDNLKAFDELIEEFVAQGKLSRKDALDKMITSIYYSEWGTDEPQNYFTWKDIGSKKFVKLFLTATELIM